MSDINKVFLLARLGKKPEIKHLDNGTAVVDLWVANNAYRKDKDDKVNWFGITVFGKRGESCEKCLDTGSQVAIEGHLDYQTWENKEGQKRSAIKIIADSVQFVGKKKEGSDESQPEIINDPEPDVEVIPETVKTPVESQEPINPADLFEQPIENPDDPPF